MTLMHFASLHYQGQPVLCRYLGGSARNRKQEYDREIQKIGGTIDRIEIAAPRNGELENLQAKQMIEKGISDIICCTYDEKYKTITDLILTTARKKAQKNYNEVIVVICFIFLSYFRLDLAYCVKRYMENIVNQLRQIDYTAKEVYFMIPPYESFFSDRTPFEKFTGEIIKIK